MQIALHLSTKVNNLFSKDLKYIFDNSHPLGFTPQSNQKEKWRQDIVVTQLRNHSFESVKKLH